MFHTTHFGDITRTDHSQQTLKSLPFVTTSTLFASHLLCSPLPPFQLTGLVDSASDLIHPAATVVDLVTLLPSAFVASDDTTNPHTDVPLACSSFADRSSRTDAPDPLTTNRHHFTRCTMSLAGNRISEVQQHFFQVNLIADKHEHIAEFVAVTSPFTLTLDWSGHLNVCHQQAVLSTCGSLRMAVPRRANSLFDQASEEGEERESGEGRVGGDTGVDN
ncbi:hypothetical protein BLNAU_8024 [Blattamonas nauphoetae]|uniref:Uncharacterized protein n=1 Tax=Blattamonas nauphoetae TaxID=2049346 RepID=A0ABQ9XZT6_9EUKA|nr:hypothetical protein BLNAU_8024 [Blattamonas nauphoetae]